MSKRPSALQRNRRTTQKSWSAWRSYEKSIRRWLRWTSSSLLKEQVLPHRYAVSSKPSVKGPHLTLRLSRSRFRSTETSAGSHGRAPMWIGLHAPGSFVNLSIRKLRSATLPTPSLMKRSEEHTSELQSLAYLVCRLLLEKKKKNLEAS